MGIVKTLSEIAGEHLDAVSDAAVATFMAAIRPIYGSTEGGAPDHIGTCVLIRVDGLPYLVTAAHVLDENRNTTMYLGVNGKMPVLTGTFQATAAPGGRREDDHYDFGWQSMEAWDAAKYNQLPFIDAEKITSTSAHNENHFYVALGYPNSKNKKHDLKKRKVTPVHMTYTAKAKAMPALCEKLGLSGHDHTFIPHDPKLSRNSAGQLINSLQPRGSSGGALIDVGPISSIEAMKPGYRYEQKLAGVLIENHKDHKVIAAVNIDVVVREIRSGAL